MKIKKISKCVWEIPKHGDMRVPGRIYASEKLMQHIKNDKCIEQVINVAHLPGIQKYSLAMPDIHWGYGFPIGGVAAMDLHEGVISPGGIGFDINCGVRLMTTPLHKKDVQSKIKELVTLLFQNIPCGVGREQSYKLTHKELSRIAEEGARWTIKQGFGKKEDIEFIEENGCLPMADPSHISERAYERGKSQLGTLGSGNHFLEVGNITEIYREKEAEVLGLFLGQVTVMIHSGSRGFGHQTCTDYLRVMQKALHKYKINIPDKQLACAPLSSPEAQAYLGAMSASANYAWANRQLMMHRTREVIEKIFSIPYDEMHLIFDVCHNIAKFEEYEIDGKLKKLCVHRKGATRAFAPHHPKTPKPYQEIGQPVLVPGDMGRYSFILVGTHKAMQETFGSSCHGAGRELSRTQSRKKFQKHDLHKEMEEQGVFVMSQGRRTMAEEMPFAYKDVSDVVNSMDEEGITLKVAKIKPLGCIKG
ncbi:MAG: RtcB family protein [Deltaproteobacteria bacterium]|nr:RtcB family protein [Deltaproteobacteria bacterium]